MIPIVITGLSAASQVASPATKKAAAVATIIGIGVLAGGAFLMFRILTKPVIDFNRGADGTHADDYIPDFEFKEPGETRRPPTPKQYVFAAPPQVRPPISNNAWLPSPEFDRELEEKFYSCL